MRISRIVLVLCCLIVLGVFGCLLKSSNKTKAVAEVSIDEIDRDEWRLLAVFKAPESTEPGSTRRRCRSRVRAETDNQHRDRLRASCSRKSVEDDLCGFVRVPLYAVGLVREEHGSCLRWAFGEDYLSMLWIDTPGAWNQRHGDIFIICGSDDYHKTFKRIGKAYGRKPSGRRF